MKQSEYRFEKYVTADFPVYASFPDKRKVLVCPHYHRDAEIIKVIRGTVQINVGTASHLLQREDILFCSPFVVHEVISLSEDAQIRGLIFSTELLENHVNFSGVRDTCFLFSAIHPASEEANHVFDALQKAYAEQSPSFRLRIRAGLLLFVSLLMENGFLPGAENQCTLRTADAISYIKKNYQKEISIRELAALVNLCNDSFIRIFKKEHGQTPLAYLRNFRLCEALRLLSENRYSISEIACRTGFSGVGYFSKVFKEHLGLSPMAYKKEHVK